MVHDECFSILTRSEEHEQCTKGSGV